MQLPALVHRSRLSGQACSKPQLSQSRLHLAAHDDRPELAVVSHQHNLLGTHDEGDEALSLSCLRALIQQHLPPAPACVWNCDGQLCSACGSHGRAPCCSLQWSTSMGHDVSQYDVLRPGMYQKCLPLHCPSCMAACTAFRPRYSYWQKHQQHSRNACTQPECQQ